LLANIFKILGRHHHLDWTL